MYPLPRAHLIKSLCIWGRAHYLPLLTCWILLGPHGSPTSSGELSTPRDSVVKVYTYDKIITMVMGTLPVHLYKIYYVPLMIS